MRQKIKLTVCYFFLYHINSNQIWGEVFTNGPSKICGRQSLKNLKEYGGGFLKEFERGCLPQILLDPFLNSFAFYIII